MEIVSNITQHELNQVQTIGGVESKIKLREVSHMNLLEHVKNIPYSETTQQVSETQSTYQTTPSIVESSPSESGKIMDFSEYIEKLNNETQLINNIREEAFLAQENATSSDGEVNRLSVEVSELEKQELDIETKNSELDQQLLETYNHQSQILELIRKEQERIIQEANVRQKENQEKVVSFQGRIKDIRERITTKSEDIARKQEILKALQQTDFSDISNLSGVNFTIQESDEPVKRIA